MLSLAWRLSAMLSFSNAEKARAACLPRPRAAPSTLFQSTVHSRGTASSTVAPASTDARLISGPETPAGRMTQEPAPSGVSKPTVNG